MKFLIPGALTLALTAIAAPILAQDAAKPAITKKSASTQSTQSTQDNLLPFKATEKLLSSGLKIIIVPTGLPNLVFLQIPVQTGSGNEVEP